MNARHSLFTAALVLLCPLTVQAHPGHEFGLSLVSGALHPLSGLDHLLAMWALGAWAAQTSSHGDAHLRWALPLSFVLLMLAGAALGFLGVPIGAIEQGIAASVLVLGLLLAASARLPVPVSLALAGGFAVFHGYAHAVEGAAGMTSSYIAGFLVSSAALLLAGRVAAQRLIQSRRNIALRWSGVAVAVCGIAFLAGV